MNRSAPGPGARTRNRRGEGALLRDEIVAAAERIVEREGNEEALTLRSVAREAGISAPSIYAHFADRDAILDAVLNLAFARLRQLVLDATAGHADPVTALLAGCHAYVDFAVNDPARYRVLFGRERTPRPAAGPFSIDTVPAAWAVRLEAFQALVHSLARCVKAGRSDSTDPFVDATTLWTSMHGAVMLRQFMPDFPWPPLHATLEMMVHQLARLRP